MKKKLSNHHFFSYWEKMKKILLIMKASFIISFLFVMQVTGIGYSQNTLLDLNLKNKSVREILKTIESRSEFLFFFNDNYSALNEIVDVDVNQKHINEILDQLLSETDVSYKILADNLIVILPSSELKYLGLQQLKITGTVTDKNGAPIPGVNAVVTGTTQGTMTDIAGKYSIEVPQGTKSLTFTFIGMESQEISIGTLTQINVTMAELAISLEDVVVVGYGTQKKVNLTGSVSIVSVKQLEAKPITNISSALQGTMSGVTVVQNSGQPGKDQGTINVRGIGTLGNSSAMVLVDGLVSTINDINPSDIESITVLKDAASASIYGSRGANGVILVTTKRGKAGATVAHYNVYVGKQTATRLPDFLPSWQSQSLFNEALINEGSTPLYTDQEIQKFKDGSDPDNYPNTDWVKLFYKGSGLQQNHYFDVSGGTEKTQSFLSLGYFSQDGIVKNTGLKRYTSRFQIKSQIGSRLTVNGNMSFSTEDFKEPNYPSGEKNFAQMINGVNIVGNIIPYKYSNGYYGIASGEGNPIAFLESGSQAKNKAYYLRAHGEADLEIVKGLHFKPMLGYSIDLNQSKSFIKDIQYYNWETGLPLLYQGPNSLTDRNTNANTVTLQALLQYNKSWVNHNFAVLGGYSQEYSHYSFLQAERQYFINNALSELNAGSEDGQQGSGSSTEIALQSLFGRINYSYKNRYLIETNIRYDGSSRFAPDNRWDIYPSFSAGWRISEEKFFEPLKPLLTDLKIRGSWGLLGNQDIAEGSYYPYITTISGGQNYVFGDALASGIAPTEGANRDVLWEDNESTDFGLDASLLNGKITLTADYFIRNTHNMLLEIPIGGAFGFRGPVKNGGSVQNKGFELALGYHVTKQDFTFDVTAHTSFVKNTVTDLKGTDPIIGGWGYSFNKVGYPINSFYGYQAEGIFQTQPEVDSHAEQTGGTIAPGDIMYKDQNGDDVIDDDDRVYLGTFFPKVSYGLNIVMGWKGFDFTMFWQGTAGVKGFLRGEIMGGVGSFIVKPTSIFLDRWTPQNPTDKFPRLWKSYIQNDPNEYPSSFWIRDAGYLRLKNLQIGYTLPSKWMTKVGIQKVKIYYSGQNILTFTRFYKWVDPEIPAGDRGSTYPQVVVNTIGFNFTF